MSIKNKLIRLFFKQKKIILYILFGILTTIINIVTYTILTKLFNINYIASNIIAWIITILTAYITNKLYVFDNHGFNKKIIIKELSSFTLSRIGTLLIELLLMYILVDIFKFNDLIIKLIVTFIVVVINYILSKLYIFKSKVD